MPFEISDLRPEHRAEPLRGRVDDAVGHRELMQNRNNRGIARNLGIKRFDACRRKLGDGGLGVLVTVQSKKQFRDFENDDRRDDQIGVIADNWRKIVGTGTICEIFDSATRIDDMERHSQNARSSSSRSNAIGGPNLPRTSAIGTTGISCNCPFQTMGCSFCLGFHPSRSRVSRGMTTCYLAESVTTVIIQFLDRCEFRSMAPKSLQSAARDDAAAIAR